MSDRFKNLKEIRKESITVSYFFEEIQKNFKISKVTSKAINPSKSITAKDIHRPGLVLAGYVELFTYSRVQVFGNTEIKYLKSLSKKEKLNTLKRYFGFDVPCIIVTDNNRIPSELIKLAGENGVTVFKTIEPTTKTVYIVGDFLDDQFAPHTPIHGAFVDVYGIGMLLVGKAGIGKSEIALDLVERGHRLVADDIVIVSKKAESVLIGSGTELIQHFMEIRGLGIINIKKIFGIRAIRYQKRVEVIVELENWGKNKSIERVGLVTKYSNIMGIDLETIHLPIYPGKSITVLAEVIALNYLCKHYGYDAANVLAEKLKDAIKSNKEGGFQKLEPVFKRTVNYFEHDFE